MIHGSTLLLIFVVSVGMIATYGISTAHADIQIKDVIEIKSVPEEIHNLFGSSVTSIGDIDGNGVSDIAVGAPGHADNTIGIGDVYLVMLDENGMPLVGDDGQITMVEINTNTENGPDSLGFYSQFGSSISSIGDIDDNGIMDIAVGAPGHPTQTMSTGSIYVIMLGEGGMVLSTVEINADTENGPTSLEDGDLFGSSIAQIGDIDGNGIMDIAVGAPGHHSGGIASGDVYILLLGDAGMVLETMEINADTPNGPFLEISNRFGASISPVGDIDGNGTPDIAVGAPGYYDRGITSGDVYIILLDENATVLNTIDINSETPNGPTTLEKGDHFGESVALVGDLDGNGVSDLAVGAPGHSLSELHTGDLYILHLETGGTVIHTFEINENTPNGPELEHLDYFGSSVALIGDPDRNDIVDIAVGAPGSDTLHMILLTSTNLTGTIYSDINRNGTMDAGEPGIEGHTMITYNSATGTFTELLTGPDGTYSQTLNTLPELLLIQSSYYPSGTILSSDEWYKYAMPESGVPIQLDIGFYPVPSDELVTLDVTTFYDDNRNGMMDAGEAPFPDVEITAYTYTIGPLSSITTDESGMATRADLVPADFLAQVVLPAGYEATSPIHTYSDGVEVPGALIVDGTSFDSTYTMMIGLSPVQ